MIKARSGSLAILGLEAGNIDHLKNGKPMLVKLKELGLPDISIVILYGDTHTDIVGKIQTELGLKIPDINPINDKPV